MEKSSYIDLNERMRKESFLDYYLGKKLLLPKSSDLSYYNWKNGKCKSNETEAFCVETNNKNNVETIYKSKYKIII